MIFILIESKTLKEYDKDDGNVSWKEVGMCIFNLGVVIVWNKREWE